jgi:hypothetical protein
MQNMRVETANAVRSFRTCTSRYLAQENSEMENGEGARWTQLFGKQLMEVARIIGLGLQHVNRA